MVKRDVNGHGVGRSVRLRGRSGCDARRRGDAAASRAARPAVRRAAARIAPVRRAPGSGSR
ncbi:hypothetical protein A8H35_21390 [Burkholderia thailandensis]|nr:hypothetical protein A8H35_21390 [Burkholderia thailandensis]AWY64922.1 hypothetical protein A8H36_06440 [Burkholderia thailandensis]NOK44356.1 hypothetical protein [Burkholderia thailandensis]NOK55303.1 hypothetical protein [Burkholderia thailandensis]PNE72723.1 hypothetical protein A8H38_12195 [Burkholderia thailandensis]